MFRKNSLEKFFNLKFDNGLFLIPFFGVNSYYKLFDLLVEYESVDNFSYYKARTFSSLFYLLFNLFSIFLAISLFLLIFIYKVQLFSLDKNFIFNIENKFNFFYDYNVWFPNVINVLIYSFLAFFGFFLNSFWAKFVIYLLKRFLFGKYNISKTENNFEFLDNFDLKKFINSVLVDTENCKKKDGLRKICGKYQTGLKRTSKLRRKIPLDNLFFTRNFTRLYYIRLKNRKEISEFDGVVTEMQNYYGFYTVIFAYIFNKEQKGFNRKKFFMILSKILFFYLLVIGILIFAIIFALFNDFQLITPSVSGKIISGISAVLVLLESIDLLKQFFIEGTYRRLAKKFFVTK